MEIPCTIFRIWVSVCRWHQSCHWQSPKGMQCKTWGIFVVTLTKVLRKYDAKHVVPLTKVLSLTPLTKVLRNCEVQCDGIFATIFCRHQFATIFCCVDKNSFIGPVDKSPKKLWCIIWGDICEHFPPWEICDHFLACWQKSYRWDRWQKVPRYFKVDSDHFLPWEICDHFLPCWQKSYRWDRWQKS